MKIISIHIPKTGGKTFIDILNGIYPNMYHDNKDIPGRTRFHYHKRIAEFDCVHGHFQYSKYEHLKRPYITWLRNPVERIISNYYWQLSRPTGRKDPQVNRLKEENLSLIEWAKMKGNEITEIYLENHPPEDFAFIGFTDDYNRSLKRLGRLLNVNIPMNYKYKNKGNKPNVNIKTKKILAEILNKDMEYYYKARGIK